MEILKSIDKVLAAFGNVRALERLHVDTFTEEKIKNISGVKIAESRDGQLWVKFQELNEFLFMNVTILSHLDLKSSAGAILVFFTKDYEIEIDSDENDIESSFSNVSNTWITEISFVISTKEKDIIKSINFEELEYHFRRKKIHLRAIKA